MNDNLFLIREKPKFTISFLKDTLEIIKDNNPLNNKSYKYDNIKSVYLKNEFNIFTYLIGNILLSDIYTGNNQQVLIIETNNSADEIFLKNCDMEKVNRFIGKINSIIS